MDLFSTLIEFLLRCSSILAFLFLGWKLGAYTYEVATTHSGIHYVKQERRHLQMNTSVRNPFHFNIDCTRTSSSGITCILKCDRMCHVMALWGVPISTLFEFLNQDWPVLVKSVTSVLESKRDPEDFASKCAYNNEPFLLSENVEKTVEFKLPSAVMITERTPYLRKTYPFVLLMVLVREDDLGENTDTFAIASANAVHIPDNALNKVQLIGQFIKLSSGHVGEMRKVFLSSLAEGNMNDLCVICYQRSVDVVQLACRHACVCRQCYDKCDKCPLCRNANMDFFELPNAFDVMDSPYLSEETR